MRVGGVSPKKNWFSSWYYFARMDASLRHRVWVFELFKFNPLFLTAFFEEKTGFLHGITKLVGYRVSKKACGS